MVTLITKNNRRNSDDRNTLSTVFQVLEKHRFAFDDFSFFCKMMDRLFNGRLGETVCEFSNDSFPGEYLEDVLLQ